MLLLRVGLPSCYLSSIGPFCLLFLYCSFLIFFWINQLLLLLLVAPPVVALPLYLFLVFLESGKFRPDRQFP